MVSDRISRAPGSAGTRILLSLALVAAALAAAPTVGAQHRARLSLDLLQHEARRASERTRLIVHGTRDEIADLSRRHGVQVVRWLADGAVLRASGPQVSALAADRVVDHLSGDLLVRPSMSVAIKSTGADRTWAGSPGLLGLGGIAGVTGKGIGVAVIDSGITVHAALQGKVVANVSMIAGDPSTEDAYGHGTHVAGIIAGRSMSSTSLYPSGVAPGVQLINIRVLGADGSGYTSDVIAGIDWAITQRQRYNIRVINLSLGHPVMEPAATDPLCEAVARAVAAGIVVVVAAGNSGQTDGGVRIMGSINSPGNSPLAITVGATDTKGTVTKSDDSVAPYSSRGPTKFDFAVKPDLVAPGSRLVSLEAANAYLPLTYPLLHRAGAGNDAYMHLSGTSMAAPIVSGAVGLLLQAAPGLTTAHVKMALQSGATPVEDGGLMGAGAGSLDIWASRQIAAKGLPALVNSLTSIVSSLFGESSGAFFWDSGTLAHKLYRRQGLRLLSILDLSRLWSNPVGVEFDTLYLAGLTNRLSSLAPNDLIWGEVATWAANDEIIWGTNDEIIWGTNDEIIWGTTIHDPNGNEVIWGTSGNDEIIWGTDVLTSNQ